MKLNIISIFYFFYPENIKTLFLGLILRFSKLNVLHKGLLMQDWVFRMGFSWSPQTVYKVICFMSYRFAQILEKFGGHLFFFSYLQAKGFHDHHKPSTKSSATFLNSKKLTSINLKVVPRCHQSQYREVTQWELKKIFFFLN